MDWTLERKVLYRAYKGCLILPKLFANINKQRKIYIVKFYIKKIDKKKKTSKKPQRLQISQISPFKNHTIPN